MITFGRRIREMTRQGGKDTGKAVDTGSRQGWGGLKASKLQSAFMSTGGRSWMNRVFQKRMVWLARHWGLKEDAVLERQH